MSKPIFTVDREHATLSAEYTIAAPKETVWQAWTTKDGVEKWWAPAPWRIETEEFSFTEGGKWRYRMVGPNGEVSAGEMTFIAIDPCASITATDAFLNEDGSQNTDLPVGQTRVTFLESNGHTVIQAVSMYQSPEELDRIIAMGAEDGFGQSLTQLENYVMNK